MSYIQPENSNRVNSIKQKFESAPETNASPDHKCLALKTKESLCRTLSASPIAPRKNFTLQVTRQLSNPGRNIKRTPAFRGDKLSRTKNLNSPTKEKTVSLVDKNVKLFEDKPEYGKIGNVKKKVQKDSTVEEFTMVYDDVDSVVRLDDFENRNLDLTKTLQDTVGYGKILSKGIDKSKDSRSQSLERSIDKKISDARINECKDSVRTTVISRHKNISSLSGGNNHSSTTNAEKRSGVLSQYEYNKRDDVSSLFKLDKFIKNGVEYTKVIKPKSKQIEDGKSPTQSYLHNFHDQEDELPDIREELSRRKCKLRKKVEQFPGESKFELPRGRNQHPEKVELFGNESDNCGQKTLGFVPVKDIILRDKSDDLSRKSSSFNELQGMFDNKLTDTLKAALKAPLPAGPPPKKPPRTFAHSPITNRSPVDDYEEVDGFWQKKKVPSNEITCMNLEQEALNDRKEKIRSFLHDTSTQQLKMSLGGKNRQMQTDSPTSDKPATESTNRSGDSNNDFEELEKTHGKLRRSPNLDSHLHRIKERNKSSPNFGGEVQNSGAYEPISVPVSKTDNQLTQISVSLSKLGISSRRATETENNVVTIDSTTQPKGSFSATHALNETTSSEDNSTSLHNISYSPQKFKTSPVRSASTTRSRSCKDSKEMLEKLEHVLIQHTKACGPKVIIPRTDKLDIAVTQGMKPETISRHKEIFQKRLSRTLEEAKKLGPLPDTPDSLPEKTRNLAFDCLPSLNCAGNSSIYEQIQNPDFKTYLTDDRTSGSLARTENIYSKSGITLISNSQFYLDNNNENLTKFLSTDPYDTLIISPASKRLSTELTTFSDAKKQIKKEEPVYAEPFTFDKNFSTDISRLSESGTSSPRSERKFRPNKHEDSPKTLRKGAELHYMIEQLLDQAFGQPVMAGSETPTDSNTSSDTDSLASVTSISEETSTFGEKLQIFKDKEKISRSIKAELHRTQTDRRKNYLRRVSSKFTDRNHGGLTANREDNLFEACILVELNLSTKIPYVKDRYPAHVTTSAWIENFCFPDGLDWPPMESEQNLAYTFVLTDEKGNRRYGYCRRVKPEGAPVCLPLAYCLISKHRASGFYAKLLDELESRHGQPDIMKRSFIERLYNSTMPQPGQALRLKTQVIDTVNEPIIEVTGSETTNNVTSDKYINSYGKLSSAAMPKLTAAMLDSERSKAGEDLSNGLTAFADEEYFMIRMDDHRLEEKDMSQLFDAVSTKVLLALFSSLLLERKVVLISSKLSKLSSCVEALQSLLYPFSWPHPFIPFLPNIPEFSEILQAPSPFVIGILKQRNGSSIEIGPFEDGIVVDLDTSKVISAVGDESSILPSRLQKGLKSALQIVSNTEKSGVGFRNYSISEAFLRVFVETIAHCDSHIVTQQDGKFVFEKESFVKAAPSRGVQYFLEWFVETMMFNQFIQYRILRVEGLNLPATDRMKLFGLRLAEYKRAADKNGQIKKSSTKKKTFGDRFKDLTNFN